ncbi:MAG TPA: DUF4190 domain-containing protein [Blastocatellia bacterium]|nr:DUF4190 domain-containing protein [Blastocatellia bacterium]
MQEQATIPLKKGMAIASLVLGIISIPTCGLLVVGSIAGIVLGILAINNANKKPNQFGGKGLAIGGIVTSIAGLFLIAINSAIAIPQMNKMLKVGREAATIQLLQEVHRAEGSYYSKHNKFGTLKELAEEGLLRNSLSSGRTTGGYIYTESAVTEKTFCIHATRVSSGDGYKDYNVSEDGEVRYVESKTPLVVPCGGGTSLYTESDGK